MLSLKTCTFCKKEIRLGTGTMFVKYDGTIIWLCSSKCRKSYLKLKRDPRQFKWSRELDTKTKTQPEPAPEPEPAKSDQLTNSDNDSDKEE